MSSVLKIFGVTAIGGLAILVAGLLISATMNLGWDWLFAIAIIIFVVAGAIGLISRSR